jgi:hypothetical protein
MTDAPESADFQERRTLSIWDRLDDLGRECQSGHKRLRTRLEELEKQADERDEHQRELAGRIDIIERTPPDVTKLRFSTGVVVSIVVVTISIVGTGYGVGNMVMSRIGAFEARMDRQSDEDKTERANVEKRLEERYLRSEKQFEAFGRQMELMKYEQQRLREDVTKKNGSTR